MSGDAPPKFNMAPEKSWLEYSFPFGGGIFSGAMFNFQGVSVSFQGFGSCFGECGNFIFTPSHLTSYSAGVLPFPEVPSWEKVN